MSNQVLVCPIDDRRAEEAANGVFVHADDGTPSCVELPDITEIP